LRSGISANSGRPVGISIARSVAGEFMDQLKALLAAFLLVGAAFVGRQSFEDAIARRPLPAKVPAPSASAPPAAPTDKKKDATVAPTPNKTARAKKAEHAVSIKTASREVRRAEQPRRVALAETPATLTPPRVKAVVAANAPATLTPPRVKAVVAASAPARRLTPSVATPDYERRVADAASIGAEEPNRAIFRLEHIAAAVPGRPEAYETLAAIYLRQGDFYQAYEMFDSAIRNGGKATFSMMHDHDRGSFDAGAKATCVGALTIQPEELTFEGADGHRFATSWAELREAGSNRFFGSSIGGFHVKVTADGKSRNFNLAPSSRDKREANIILDLLIEIAQRQDSGR
jgi:hypothetical protein